MKKNNPPSLAVIWDFNGTLVDDAWLFVEILNSFLKKNNKNLISVSEYCDSFFFPVESFYKSLGLYKNKAINHLHGIIWDNMVYYDTYQVKKKKTRRSVSRILYLNVFVEVMVINLG